MGLGTIPAVLRDNLPQASMLGHRALDLDCPPLWGLAFLLTQSPSARLPAPPVLCVEPARLPAGPGSTAATPHLAAPSQDSVCQLPILGLLFLPTELLSLPLLQEIEH